MFTAEVSLFWKIRTTVLAVIVLLLLCPLQPALASMSRRLSLSALVDRSTSIVVATCASAHSRWTPDHSQIETEATFDVAETLKGPVRQRITIVTLGGVVDDVGMYVSGMPVFVAGRNELLFLASSNSSSMKIVGMAQGQFLITRNQYGGDTVSRVLNGISLLGQSDPALDDRRLDALTTMIRRQVGARG